MGYAEYMRDLLRPLGIYSLEGGLSGAELDVIGQSLDKLAAQADRAEREALLATAEAEGLAAWEALFPYRPLREEYADRRAAVGALLRIDGHSFTPEALADTVRGSGFRAVVEEGTGAMTITVRFPDVRGQPADFDEVSRRISEILPCHLNIAYVFRYPFWHEVDACALTWAQLDTLALSWRAFEGYPFSEK